MVAPCLASCEQIRSVPRMWMISRPHKRLPAAKHLTVCMLTSLTCAGVTSRAMAGSADKAPPDAYALHARPLIQEYCLGCHSTAKHKSDLDLERFGSLGDLRKDVAPWQSVAEM